MQTEYVQLKLNLIYKRPVEERIVRREERRAFRQVMYSPTVTCTKCGEKKPTYAFPPDYRNTGRLCTHSHCHECQRIAKQEARKKVA